MATKKIAPKKTAAPAKAEKPLAPYKSKKQLHVLLTEAEMRKIVKLAKARGTNGTGVIRQLIEAA